MTIDISKHYCLNPAGFHRIASTNWGALHHARTAICAHGFSRNGRDFDRLAAALAERDYRVYCPDAVGRGASDWLTQRSHYNYDQYVRDSATLVSHATASYAEASQTPAPPHLDWIGTSMGGMVGMMLAARPGTPIRRLVLNDIGACISAQSLNRIGAYVSTTPTFATLAAYQAHLAEIHASFGPLGDAGWRHLAEHSYRLENGRYLPHYDPAIASAFDEPIEEDVETWDLWTAIEVPTLIIRGEQSDLLSAETLDRMVELRPDTQVVEIADAGHAPALMREQELEPILAFLMDSAAD
ncbi:alpha/beta fold hydrolase [Salinisphaera orenii]|uniref:Alpha/beta hydrolase n=1 Tax=Salinisphaera orenii YIM 95161 TaxID=1051139 RepID=A0A423PK47_9GAMM|nr:alpha/beta hydrolase [Salinisphaera halophila]ROO25980.1 alpha/beta hydrolase [Salinisphaera halophila YIM 95161]